MAKFIKTIVDRIQLANRKGLCPYYSPDQICDEVHAESMNIWRKYIKQFPFTEEIEMYLRPLKGSDQITLASGIGTIVNSKEYIYGAATIEGYPVKVLLSADKYYNLRNDSVRVPDAKNAIALINVTTVSVYPTNATASLLLFYVKRPKKPVYAFTQSGDDYLYDDASSIDFEWTDILHDEINNRVLANLGISQREVDMVQYSNLEKQSEGK